MPKHHFLLVLIITLFGYLSVCMAEQMDFLTGIVHFKTSDLDLKVEIAANETQRETGLMYRPELDFDRGMLFVFEEKAIINVWMKNTLIPLDAIFIDQTGKIVSILKNLPPCKQAHCPIYHSSIPASFMLEVNAGFIEQQHIQTGQMLKLPF